MLLDSNIIIYSAQPENALLRQFIAEHDPKVSALSYVEVLGYHRLAEFGDELFFLPGIMNRGWLIPKL